MGLQKTFARAIALSAFSALLLPGCGAGFGGALNSSSLSAYPDLSQSLGARAYGEGSPASGYRYDLPRMADANGVAGNAAVVSYSGSNWLATATDVQRSAQDFCAYQTGYADVVDSRQTALGMRGTVATFEPGTSVKTMIAYGTASVLSFAVCAHPTGVGPASPVSAQPRAPASPSAQDFTNFINSEYVSLLGRAADAQGLAAYNGAMNNGLSQQDFIAALANSDEAAAQIRALAISELGRDPATLTTDQAKQWWASALVASGSLANLKTVFDTSVEGQAHAAAIARAQAAQAQAQAASQAAAVAAANVQAQAAQQAAVQARVAAAQAAAQAAAAQTASQQAAANAALQNANAAFANLQAQANAALAQAQAQAAAQAAYDNQAVVVYRMWKGGDYLITQVQSEGIVNGYSPDAEFRMFAHPLAGRSAVYRCSSSIGHFVSTDSNCEGYAPENNIVGYLNSDPGMADSGQYLSRKRDPSGYFMISAGTGAEGAYVYDAPLGYAPAQ